VVFRLDDTAGERLVSLEGFGDPPPPLGHQLVDADCTGASSEALMLYLVDEPAMGEVFTYHGLQWLVVDYVDGWVARLLVD
jgi:hypothetical protein